MNRHKFIFFLLLILAPGFSACNKVMVYATDHTTPAVTQSFKQDASQLYHQAVRVLDRMGYEIVASDEMQYQITTGWKPATSGSHYLELFKRKDYAASDGTYYQLQIQFVPEGSFARAEVATKIKSASGKLSSSKRLEKEFIARLGDAVRSPQIEITNVGLENR